MPASRNTHRDLPETFSQSLLAELIQELPAQRRRLVQAHADGDLEMLRQAVHYLLGAVVYCDAPELEHALRELHLAIRTEGRHHIDIYQQRVLDVIDCRLHDTLDE